jgi:tetratricopeptide (TPR) repeat protein
VKARHYSVALEMLTRYFANYGSDNDLKNVFFESLASEGISDSVLYYLKKNLKYLGKGTNDFARALLEYQHSNFFVAVNYMISAIEKEPTNGYYYFYLGLMYYLNRDYVACPMYKVVSYLRKAEELNAVAVTRGLRNYIELNFYIKKGILSQLHYK